MIETIEEKEDKLWAKKNHFMISIYFIFNKKYRNY